MSRRKRPSRGGPAKQPAKRRRDEAPADKASSKPSAQAASPPPTPPASSPASTKPQIASRDAHGDTASAIPFDRRHIWEFQAVRDVGVLVTLGFVAWAAYSIQALLLPVFLGLALAYVANPLIAWAKQTYQIQRWLSALLLIVFFTGVVAALALMTAVPMLEQANRLRQEMPIYLENLYQWADEMAALQLDDAPDNTDPADPDADSRPDANSGATSPAEADIATDSAAAASADAGSPTAKPLAPPSDNPASAGETPPEPTAAANETTTQQPTDEAESPNAASPDADGDDAWSWSQPPTTDQFVKILNQGMGKMLELIPRGGLWVFNFIALTTYLFAAAGIMLFSFYCFAWRFDGLVKWFDPFLPHSKRDRVIAVVKKMDATIAAFVRGRILQAAIMGLVLTVGWQIVGMKYFLLLGVISGGLNLIPFAGALGWAAAVLVTFVSELNGQAGLEGVHWLSMVWVTVVYLFAQTLDNYLVEPWVQGQATNLSPMTVMLAVLVGGGLGGLLGLMVAIPVAACLRILADEVWLPNVKRWMDTH